jgi:hypothetical protein
VAALALALGLTACGGGESQDANEPSGDFPVNAKASFPDHQQLVQNADLELNVDNVGDETIPNLAVTIHTTPSPTPAGEPRATAHSTFASTSRTSRTRTGPYGFWSTGIRS